MSGRHRQPGKIELQSPQRTIPNVVIIESISRIL